MWQVDNRTPFAAAQSWIRNLEGAETWVVVVKATFDVLPDGSTQIAETQPEPARAAVYRGEPGRSSILYDNDFVLLKSTTDVVVNATAYAPRGRLAAAVDVAVQVGAIKKRLRVVGDRSWTAATGLAGDPQPFVTMPITYERAFGGVDPHSKTPDLHTYWPNPVGTGFTLSDRGLAHVPVPNIEHADEPIGSWNGRPRPAGLGVLGSSWQARANFAGTYDQSWMERRLPLLPRDFDVRFFQCVPQDQQSPQFLNGGELVSLINLTPLGSLRFAIPVMDLQLETRFMDGERRRHPPMRLHTVIVEPDAPRVALVWHSAIECHSQVYKLNFTRVESALPLPGYPGRLGSLLDL